MLLHNHTPVRILQYTIPLNAPQKSFWHEIGFFVFLGIVRAVARDFFDSEIKMEVLDESHEEERNGKKEHVTFAIFVQKKKHPKPPPSIVTTDQTNDLNQSQMVRKKSCFFLLRRIMTLSWLPLQPFYILSLYFVG